KALLDGQFFLDCLDVFTDAATAGAGQVAGMQGLEHEHQRKALLSGQLLPGDVTGHRGCQSQRETHARVLSAIRRTVWVTIPIVTAGILDQANASRSES